MVTAATAEANAAVAKVRSDKESKREELGKDHHAH